jgi:DNA repair protein RAD50
MIILSLSAFLHLQANRLRGTVSAYEGNIKRNRTELRDPRYADVENRYRNQLIQLKTTEMANKDLDKYYHALDK